MSCWRCNPRADLRMTAEWVSSFIKKCPRELEEEIPVVGEYALRRRTEVVGKVRVLTS